MQIDATASFMLLMLLGVRRSGWDCLMLTTTDRESQLLYTLLNVAVRAKDPIADGAMSLSTLPVSAMGDKA